MIKVDSTKENVIQIMEKVNCNTDAIKNLKENMGRNTEEIQGIKLAITRMERENDIDEERIEERLRSISNPPNRTPFQKSRSFIRMWPIPGRNDDEMRQEVKKFVIDALGLSLVEYDELTITSVRRVRSATASKVHTEVLVTFSEPEQRDFVFSKGNNLSDYIKDGKPTAGMRMDVPADLVDIHKLLNDLGYQIRRRFEQGTRKYVNFDSENESLYLEVRLPDSFNWLRITPDMARTMKKNYDEKELHCLNIADLTPAARLASQPGPRNPRSGPPGPSRRAWTPSSYEDMV